MNVLVDSAGGALNGLTGWLATPRWLIGAAIARMGFGFIVLSLFLVNWRPREALWGPHGVYPLQSFAASEGTMYGFDIFALSGSSVVFELLYLAGILVSIAFMIGFKTRFTSLLFVAVSWSIYHRAPFVMNGGSRLMNILLIYLVFADLGAVLSVDAWLAKRRAADVKPGLSQMLHNAAVLTCIVQLCFVYLFSVFYKVQGEAWQQGTALYYAVENTQFLVSPISEMVAGSPLFVTLGSYATLLYQCAFPWLILHPTLRYPILAIGALFHLGIAFSMGLWWFSAVMIVSETLILSDLDYGAIARAWRAAGDLFQRAPARVAEAVTP